MRSGVAIAAVMAVVLALAGHPQPSAGSSRQAKKGEPQKGAEAPPKPVEPIDPRGEPKPAALKSIPGPKACVSHDRDGWQVQLRSGNAGWTRINGWIEPVGGQIDKVNGFGDLETAVPGKKNAHADQGRFDKRHIEFEIWVNTGRTDTFHFFVSEETQAIRFRFRINGGPPTSESVLIGKDGRRPSQGEFYLHARPDHSPATKDVPAAEEKPADAPKAKPARDVDIKPRS